MSHDYVSTHCLNCGGFLGDVCVDCGHVSDGGEYMASNPDAWCNCDKSVSDFGCDAHGQPYDDDDAEQMRAPDVLVRCRDCGALLETDVHCDNCGSFHPTRG